MKTCPVCGEQFADNITFCANDGEVLEADPTSLVGQKLDNQYFVESLLGKGGMGSVYLARHILLGDRVALKVLTPEMRNNAEWLKRFQREGQAARRFRHPNAVTVHDLRTSSDGLTYLVMEYIQGQTLSEELAARGRFTAEEAFFMLEPVMSVLHAAHIQGVVHRDIKPDNIMAGKGPNGQPFVKLLDLGVAKMLPTDAGEVSGTTKLTVQGQLLGTPFYMSPEQWGELMRDGHDEVDGRADLYSLAVVLHEMVAGHKPFFGLSMLELRNAHVKSLATPLYNLRPDVPQAFSDAVQRALSKDRNDRQPNIQVFADELRDAIMQPQPVVMGGNYAPPPVYAVPPGGPTKAEVPGPPTGVAAPPKGGQATAAYERSDAQTVVEGGGVGADARATIVEGGGGSGDARATIVDGADRRTAVPGGPNIQEPAPVAVVQETAPAFIPVVAPEPARDVVMPPPAAKSGFPLALLAIPLLLFLLAGGAGGVWYFFLRAKPTTGDAAANAPETLRYWLEVTTLDKDNKPVGAPQKAAAGPLRSGQSFKFHFKAPANGYLYIIAPGANETPTTFLTPQPMAESGVTTNRLNAGNDFVFPAGPTNWITLGKETGTEVFTLIFAPELLMQPDFLNTPAGKALNSAQWDEFKTKYKANTASPNVSTKEDAPFAAVNAPTTNAPALFEIRLEHK